MPEAVNNNSFMSYIYFIIVYLSLSGRSRFIITEAGKQNVKTTSNIRILTYTYDEV